MTMENKSALLVGVGGQGAILTAKVLVNGLMSAGYDVKMSEVHGMAGAARTLGHVCAPSLQQLTVARCAAVRPDLEAYDRNRTVLYDALTSYGYECAKPNGAFYMFVKAPGGDAQAFSDRAKAKNLLLVPGGDFGCPDFFRVSTCVSPEMIQRSLPVFRAVIEEMAAR